MLRELTPPWRKRLEHARLLLTYTGARARAWFGQRLARGKPSLVNRLSAFLLIGAIVIYLIGVAGLYLTSSRMIEDSLRKQAGQWIAEMEALGTPLYFARKADPTPIETRLRASTEIRFVRYYDASGKHALGEFGHIAGAPSRTLSDRELVELAALAHSDTPYLFDDAGAFIHVVAPVRVRSVRGDGMFNFDLADTAEDMRIIGYIELAIDPSSYRAQLRNSFVFGSIVIAVILLVAIVVGRRLIRRALHPLTELQTPLARLAKGEIDVSVATGGDSEIAAIANALNVTIGALKQQNEALHRLAERDALTGLYNRNYFSRLLDTELAWVKRGKMSSALLFIDLDRFKYVNDTLGHGAGDRLLVEVAELIKARMRGHDVVSRFGGDEFTVVAHDVSKRDAVSIAKGVHDLLLDYQFVDQEQSFTVSCTIGIAMITRDTRDAEEVLSQADAACYEAKAGGRNRYHLYEPDQQQKLEFAADIGWSELIKAALKTDGFTLMYQPIVGIGPARQEFYEVLLRMPDRKGEKLLMPGLFLPVAERFGLLVEIDRWVIEHALDALAGIRAQGRDVVFSINISGQTMADTSAIRAIEQGLTRRRLPASAVVFEITEQTAVRYIDMTHELTQELIRLGCRFALDDFGVGFSSLSHLKRLPVSLVKIDGCFIENLVSEPIDQIMVSSIVQIAKALDKQVIAEFVQNEATVELLRSYGVDYVQGSLVGKPAPNLPLQPVTLPAARKHKPSRHSDAA